MGSPLSLVVADLFMELFDHQTLEQDPLKPSVLFRYVDDVFVIWFHGKERLNTFLQFINS